MTTKPNPAPQTTPPPLLPQYGAEVEPLPNPPKKPDAWLQFPHAARAYLILEHRFRHRPDVLVGGRGYLCEVASDYSDYIVPDCEQYLPDLDEAMTRTDAAESELRRLRRDAPE